MNVRHEPSATCTPDCFGCKLSSITFGKVDIDGQKAWGRQKQRDTDAYVRLRHDHVQPNSVQGAAELESRAASLFEVESRINLGGNAKAGKHYDEVQNEINKGKSLVDVVMET